MLKNAEELISEAPDVMMEHLLGVEMEGKDIQAAAVVLDESASIFRGEEEKEGGGRRWKLKQSTNTWMGTSTFRE